MAKWPKGYETPEKRKEKGQAIALMVRGGLTDRSVREQRWDRCRSLYRNIPAKRGKLPYKGAADEHLNIVQVVVDALGTHVVGTITSQEPYCQATLPTTDQELLDGMLLVQKAVWFFCRRGKLQKALQKVSQPAAWSNAGHLRCEWDEDRPKFSVYDPDYTVVYPATVECLDEAVLYGTKLWRRKSQVKKFQENGTYLNEGDVSGYIDPGKEKEKTFPSIHDEISHTPQRKGDENCELWRVCVKDDDGEKWWMTVSAQDGLVLKIDKYPEDYSACDVWKFAYKNETGTGYYSSGSVCNDVQGGQLTVNELASMLIDGIRFNSFGVMVSESWPGASTDNKVAPGDWIQGQNLGSTQYFNPKADLAYVPEAMWSFTDYQNKVARISNMGSGGSLKSGATATEAGGMLAGQQAGINEYISVFGEPLEGDKGVFAFVQSLLYTHFTEWIDKYGSILGIGPEHYELFELPIEWELSASTPSATPQSQIQAIQTLVPLAGQMPGMGINQYQLGKALVTNLQKMGVMEAGEFQYPEGPEGVAQYVSTLTGIPPEMVMAALDNAKQQIQQLQSQAAPSGPPQEPGMAALPGMGQEAAGGDIGPSGSPF